MTSTKSDVREELRLALILNGGVSLAVWMSGVVSEIDALRWEDPVPSDDVTVPIYGALKKLLASSVCVDVIAGTSAGGLNGALLAGGIVKGKRINPIRRTWLEDGDLGRLLRDPGEEEPASLLQGDARLLTAIHDAFTPYFQPPPAAAAKHVDLTLTGTDMFGVAETPFTDSFGGQADRTEYRLQFRFSSRLRPGCALLTGAGNTELIDAISRAARTSASFPFAFEPSEIAGTNSVLRQALHTRGGTSVLRTPAAARFAIDGGILDNSPIDPVLRQITSAPATRTSVRRTVMFVIPYAGSESVVKPSKADANLRRVLNTTLNIPREIPLLDDLARVEGHLRRRDSRRGPADDSLMRMPRAHLRQAGADVYDDYREREALDLAARIGAAAGIPADIATGPVTRDWIATHLGEIASVPTADGLANATASGWNDTPEWLRGAIPPRRAGRRVLRRIREARAALPLTAPRLARDVLREAQTLTHRAMWNAGLEPDIAAVATGGAPPADPFVALRARLTGDVTPDEIDAWAASWNDIAGAFVAARMAVALGAAAAVVTAAGAVEAAFAAPAPAIGPDANALIDTAGTLRARSEALQLVLLASVFEPLAPDTFTPASYAAVAQASALSEEAEALLAGATGELATPDYEPGSIDDESKGRQRGMAAAQIEVGGARKALRTLLIEEGAPNERIPGVIWRLMLVDVVTQVVAAQTEAEQATDVDYTFMRLCADPPHPGGPANAPSEKLYGLQLGHFAGFVRRSWRTNDWLWGRLDGAARLVDALLEPRRLREHPVNQSHMRDTLLLHATATGVTAQELVELVRVAIDEKSSVPEDFRELQLAYLDRLAAGDLDGPLEPGEAGTGDTPDDPSDELQVWRHAWRLVLQIAILRAELSGVADAVDYDVTQQEFRPGPKPLLPADATSLALVKAFATYASEVSRSIPALVADERHSNAGARLVAKAASVGAAVVGSRTNGLPAIASVAVRATRGTLRVARFAVESMTGTRLQRALFVLATALAGLTIGLAAKDDLPEAGSKPGSGSASLASGAALAIALPIIIVALAGVWRPSGRRDRDRLAATLLGIAVSAAFVALVAWIWGEPLSVADAAARTHRVTWAVLLLVALSIAIGWLAAAVNRTRYGSLFACLVVAAAAIVGADRLWRQWIDWQWLQDAGTPLSLGIAAAVAAVLAFALGYLDRVRPLCRRLWRWIR